jgi:hypothetical protein
MAGRIAEPAAIGGESTCQFRVDFVPFRSIPLAAQCVARRAALANNARLTVIDHHFGSWVAQNPVGL